MTEEMTPQIIKTIGEHGEEIFMKLQEIVTINDKDYAILSVAQENSLPTDDNEDDELTVMRMIKTEDECTFEVIEDDEEFKFVVEALSDDEDEEEIEE